MKTQNNKNKILVGSEPNLRSKFGAKEFYFYYFGFLLTIIALLPIITAAQFNLPSIGNIKPTISLSADSLTPLPNSTVNITANLSGLAGNGSSDYLWFINGVKQTEASGLNKNTLILKTGAISSVYRINVSITIPGADVLSDAISLTVSDVDLSWQASASEAPAAYRAKLLPTQGSTVIISALPFIYSPGTKSLISSSNLTYNWTINGKFDSEKSGADKYSYVVAIDNFFGNTYSVRLEVKTADGAVSLNKFTTIPVEKPQVWLYFSDPKTNLPFGPALKNLLVEPKDLSFIAQTYFFTVPVKDLSWQWIINNTEVKSGSGKPWLSTLSLTGFPSQFSTQIQVVAANPANDLETGQAIVNLKVK